MRFTVVEKVPGKAIKKNLRHIFDEFVNMDVKFAKFEFNENEYKHANSAYNNLTRAARKYGYPVNVHVRENEVYFERRDI